MTAAVLGLIGVAVGALLTGVVSYVVERQKERTRARVAARLIALELRVASRRILSAVASNPRAWWAGELAAEARRENLTELAFGFRLTKAELTKIDGAYALLDIWNATKGAASTGPPDEPTCVKLADDAVDIQGVECWLTSELRQRHEPSAVLWLSKRKGRAATWARRLVLGMSTRRSRILRSLAVLVVVVGALAFEVFVPRENLSSTTVAAALQSRLPADVFVDCNPRGDEWLCVENHLSNPVGSCSATARAVKSWTIVVAANCKVKTSPTEFDVSRDSNPPRLVVLPADFERIGAKADASMPIPMESLAGKIADILAGEPK